jgi:hypothetical protein
VAVDRGSRELQAALGLVRQGAAAMPRREIVAAMATPDPETQVAAAIRQLAAAVGDQDKAKVKAAERVASSRAIVGAVV